MIERQLQATCARCHGTGRVVERIKNGRLWTGTMVREYPCWCTSARLIARSDYQQEAR